MLNVRNKNIWRRLAAGAILAALLVLPALGQPRAGGTDPNFDGAVRITLLHVNDSHGHTESWGSKGVGGYARLATAVEAIRAPKAGQVFLLHAGDEFSKGDELTTNSVGAANVALMNHLKFDLFTPGNGEFYYSLDVLRQRMKEAKFPFLTANVFVKSTGETVGKPYVIETAGKIKVAFFGLCYLREGLPSAWPLRVDDPIATARKLVPELRKQADIVVAVTHIGDDADRRLAAVVGGIDVIIGGHFHTVMPHGETVKGPDGRSVLVCQAGDYLQYLGRVDLAVRPCEKNEKGYRVSFAKAELIPLDQKIKCDPLVTALIAAMAGKLQPASAPASQPVGVGK